MWWIKVRMCVDADWSFASAGAEGERLPRFVTYSEQTVNSQNPAARFAHRSRTRYSTELACSYLPNKGALVDFGAGHGALLNEVRKRRPDAILTGVEPYKPPAFPGLQYANSLSDLRDGSADLITGFEVCEHLVEEEVTEFIANVGRLLKVNGTLIVSVPIMYGPIVLLKEPSQMVLKRRSLQYSFNEFCRVVLGKPISRPADPRHTHKGFDFRKLKKKIEEDYHILVQTLSPFRSLPWYMNSQIFMLAKRRRDSPVGVQKAEL